MTVAAGFAPEPDWDRFNTPTGRPYRDSLIERAGHRSARIWPDGDQPMWSPWPIVGYRLWISSFDGVYGATGFRWEQPRLSAECRRPKQPSRDSAPHLAVDAVCHGLCGINAYSDPDVLVERAQQTPMRRRLTSGLAPIGDPLPEGLYGAVSLSGRVVEHEDGYRAQHARVIGLVLPIDTTVWATTDLAAIELTFVKPGAVGFHGWRPQLLNSTEQVPHTVTNQLRRMSNATGT